MGAAAVPAVAVVAAVADNGVIGRAGALPWHLPDDLAHFKAVTLGKPVLMGRRTFESIGRPLPGRRNLVLSHQRAGMHAGVEYLDSFEQACALVGADAQLCVIGGAQVFALALPLATRVYLTRVHGVVAGDCYFPLHELAGWRELERVEHAADARHAFAMSFLVLGRD
jgi:dihydrofolate reductase